MPYPLDQVLIPPAHRRASGLVMDGRRPWIAPAPIPISYALDAADCPPLWFDTAVPDTEATDPTPAVASKITDGMHALEMRPRFGRNSLLLDLVSRDGGGGAAVISGAGQGLLIGNGGGLVLTIGIGRARISGPVSLPSTKTLSLVDDSENYIYLLQDRSLTKVIGSLTPPATPYAYLGRATTLFGRITALDRSGVLESRGGTLWRRTGDAGAPTDGPPAGLMFWARTDGGYYLWTGDSYLHGWGS